MNFKARKIIDLHILFCFTLMFLFSSLQAQGWKKTYPPDVSNGSTYGNPGYACITSTADGGMLFSRQEQLIPDDILLSLTKVDQDGEVQWKQIYENPDSLLGEPIVYKIKQVADGGYILSGSYKVPYVGPNPVSDKRAFLKKIDANGNIVWDQVYNKQLEGTYSPIHFLQTPDGGYLISASTGDPQYASELPYTIKTDSLGNLEWENTSYLGRYFFQSIVEIILRPNNTINLIAQARGIDSLTGQNYVGIIFSIDLQGNLLSHNYMYANGSNYGLHIADAVATSDGGYLVSASESQSQRFILRKVNAAGILEWQYTYTQFIHIQPGYTRIIATSDGNYVCSADNRIDHANNGAIAFKVDDFGNILWSRDFTGTFREITETNNGEYCFVGYEFAGANGPRDGINIQLIKLTKDGVLYGNLLTGHVKRDNNYNCIAEQQESGFNKWLVEVKGNQTFYEYTDSLGYYEIELDTGAYEINAITPGPLWYSCVGTTTIQVNKGDTLLNDFPQQAVADCPLLSVDIATPMLRRCFGNIYQVSYCNQGTLASPNTVIEIEFHPHFDVVSSTIPWSSQVGNTFTFPIGFLDFNDCGSFTVTAIPNCDSTILGQTLCAKATITPDSICGNTNPLWDGSITELDVTCGTDSLTFTIENTGNGDMITSQDYLIIEDNLIAKQGQFLLLSMQTKEIKVPANGSTYRLYAGQSTGFFPPNYKPTIAIEGCGLNAQGEFSIGYINMFPENDILNTESIDCQEIIGAYDPNDKQAEPKGYNTQHYIEEGVDLEYKIRFQNTGTDTAFAVVIRDTISEHLDIATLIPGTSSHTYDLDIIHGNVLKFTFPNIQLVDSFTNEPGSHGFVKFKIGQQPNLPLGTMIYNDAAIYFDFNEPIITNQTYHEIGEDFIQVRFAPIKPIAEFPTLEMTVQPNPFIEYTELILGQAPEGRKTFKLYDALGKLVRTENFTAENSHRFYKEGLTSGIYFYTIFNNGKLIASGKMVASD